MHLLATQSRRVEDGSEAIDLCQTPSDIVILSAADTELSCLASAYGGWQGEKPTLRLANLTRLQHPYSIDLYLEKTISQSRLILVRLLGGAAYWRYGVEELYAHCQKTGKILFLLPGDDKPDEELRRLSSPIFYDEAFAYLQEGGIENSCRLMEMLAVLLGQAIPIRPPLPLPRYGLWEEIPVREGRPVVAMIFYRALLQAGQTEVVREMVRALDERGYQLLPLFAQSLKEKDAVLFLKRIYAQYKPRITLNCLSFALNESLFGDHPVFQVLFSSDTESSWLENNRGLSPRDLAMQVALPEMDGKILTRTITFKAEALFDRVTQCSILRPKAISERILYVAEMVSAWIRLQEKPVEKRCIGVVLANYPNRDGRIGNGVGLDVPQSLLAILSEQEKAGYAINGIPGDVKELMELLTEGPTNAHPGKQSDYVLPMEEYKKFFISLPRILQEAVLKRWGDPQSDPFVIDTGFHLAIHRFGSTWVGLQPARGYQIDPVQTYHDPELIPPHYYIAFYAYLRRQCDAIIHLGKHGTLEWLPGKALALSAQCWPEAILGTMPLFYPFIVNDPGEGTQAKRRSSAVIIDHMMPPLTRAEIYGPLAELEQWIDEYYQAAQLDPRRLADLSKKIIERVKSLGLDKDCGIEAKDKESDALVKLDNHLCELKELQIRDGLHVFGQVPAEKEDLLVALTRLPRGKGLEENQSLLRALANDLGMDFDPLRIDPAAPWEGVRPAALEDGFIWRSQGDSLERLEKLALDLVNGERQLLESWLETKQVLSFIETKLRPMLEESAKNEIQGLLTGLKGLHVPPGPSGAPSRGRLDVLPTGRNFYSLDTRSVPTQSAWALGWRSASQLIDLHKQEHGSWPKSFILSVWGTSNMRTGGDDIAQALAFLGVRPLWEESGRVTGFEILPLSVLDRPRIDVTLRISGFFRDAFPAQIDLFDSAVRAVGALTEPYSQNPLAAQMQKELAELMEQGVPEKLARLRAGHRIFGAKPGAYGTGLQTMIDEGLWTSHDDLGKMFIEWGSYAYGGGVQGEKQADRFAQRLHHVDAVLHNQDNREHDILDSDDYYQFEGGLTAAIRHVTGQIPAIWHNDHSNPEAPKSRTFDRELGRIVRGRAVNPKWIKGVMRHGYKGAFEMAATLDYLYAFAATTGLVSAQHFQALYEAYLADHQVRDFIAEHNPAALKEMSQRFLDAIQRGLWQVKSNSIPEQLEAWSR